MRVIIQVRELVSSNVTTMVEKASNPAKMLRLLRNEIEESDIALHGEITKLTRAKERAEASAKEAASDAKGWSDKAKTAMDHDREDLARSALLAREDIKKSGERDKQEAARLGDEITDAQNALAMLKSKLAETNAQIAALPTAEGASQSTTMAKDSTTDRRMDRISDLERRVDYAMNDEGHTKSTHATVDAEIADMQRDASVDAELEKLRKSGSGKRRG